MKVGGQFKYFLTDHLGSVMATLDSAGGIISKQRYLPFGAPRTDINGPSASPTDFGYTSQRKLDSGMGGIMDYHARFYSPAINRFLQPDILIPNLSSPQSWNRYSYVLNDPIRFNDPTGHMVACGVSSDGGCGGGGSGAGNSQNKPKKSKDKDKGCKDGDLCLNIHLHNNCDSILCKGIVTGAGLMGTALDLDAFIMNASFAAGADIAGLVFGTVGYAAIVALYKVASPIPNIIGTYGGMMWALQGLALGNTHADLSATLSSNIIDTKANLSVTYSQDTAISAINDGVGWGIPEPNLAAFSSGVGFAYDLSRNPLSPYLSSKPPMIPSVISPTYSISLDVAHLNISHGWSLFPPSH